MDGKILIPQPFGTLKNLHDKESGFAISKFMILELVVAVALVLIFTRLAKKMRAGGPPVGKTWNMLESVLVYLRDNVARPAIGEHDADRFLPLLWTVFFFILGCNLLGMVPWAGAATGAFGMTLALAAVIILTTFISGMRQFGVVGFWFNLVPHMDLPLLLRPLKLLIFAIEVVGLIIKHCVLAVRLLANMVAGHVVLLGIMGLIVGAASASTGTWATVTVISVLGSTAFSCLELFVAFLQAYIFTFLSALFIGAAIHHH
jgi:F-type H+-transporting ATPase subunit a